MDIILSEIRIDRDKHNRVVVDGCTHDGHGNMIPAEVENDGDTAFFKIFRRRKAYDVEEIKDVFLSPLNMTSLPTWEAIDQLYDIYIVVDNALDNCVDDTLSSTDF